MAMHPDPPIPESYYVHFINPAPVHYGVDNV
jgi:hypothetical protein